eukprot:9444802-Pyramimonas_sp.AAC.1
MMMMMMMLRPPSTVQCESTPNFAMHGPARPPQPSSSSCGGSGAMAPRMASASAETTAALMAAGVARLGGGAGRPRVTHA